VASSTCSPLDQYRRPVANIAGDNVFGKFRAPDMAQRGIDGMHQVQARVDECAVEIEDDQLNFVGIKRAMSANHYQFRIKHPAVSRQHST
jgi:hypothetical protein